MGFIAIIGAGESGIGAARLALKNGEKVFVSDSAEIKDKYKKILSELKVEWEEKNHNLDKILKADLCIKSPGIPENSNIVKALRKEGIQIISEVEYASRYTDSKIIAITGSNGKTTTTLLTHHILQKAGLDVQAVGNVGNSFAAAVADHPSKYYVVEISSFQLDDIDKFKPQVSVVLNITPDHLNRYDYKLENYADAKLKITQNQDRNDFFIYCIDDLETLKAMNRCTINAEKIPFSIQERLQKGAYITNNQLNFNLLNPFNMLMQDLALQGKHNLYNSMAAGIAARIFDIKKEIIRESLSDFKNIEHRLERVADVHGIEFINDSKATNVNSVWYALESIHKPIVWIVGGVDKGNDYSLLSDLVKSKVKGIVCLGKDNNKIIHAFKNDIARIEEADSATSAVQKAYEMAKKGDVVLLSPACASFDLFDNYEDRGHQFKNAVKAL